MKGDFVRQLRDWFDEPDGLPPPRLGEVAERVARTGQQRGRLPPRDGVPAMLSTFTFASAAVVLALVGGFLVTTLGGPWDASHESLPTAAPGSPSAVVDLRAAVREGGPLHVTGALKGGWHQADESGCAHLVARGAEWMECFGVMSDERLDGRYWIDPVEGTENAGTGRLWIEGATGIAWQGEWVASGAWPGEVARRSRESEADWPHPATITIEWAWLQGSGPNEGLSYVLSIRDGAIDGWVLEQGSFDGGGPVPSVRPSG